MWSARRMRWRVWLVAVLVFPVPYGGLEHGWVPSFWLAAVTSLTWMLAALEGGTTPVTIGAIFALQAVVWSAVLWLASAVVVTLAERALGPVRARVAVRCVLGALVALTLFPVYRSPISHTPGWTTLAGLWR